ncbi:hypothetical protein EPO66_02105, partial [bacterium]
MFKHFRKIYPVYIFIDVFLIALALYLPYLSKHNSFEVLLTIRHYNLSNIEEYSFVFFLWSIFIFLFFKRRSLFSTDRGLTIPKEVFRVFISIFFSALIISAIIFFAQFKFFSREIFIENCALLFIFLGLWRVAKRVFLRSMIAKGFHNINILIAGTGLPGRILCEQAKQMPWLGYKIVGFLDDGASKESINPPILGKINDFDPVIKRYFIDELVINSLDRKLIEGLINKAKEMHVGIRVISENFLDSMPILDISYFGVVPLLTYKTRKLNFSEFLIKRALDFIISLVFLIIFSPLFLAAAILSRLGGSGPIFYVQKRVGYKGRVFNVYKFRSMVNNADELKEGLAHKNEVKDGIIFKIKNDPRVTRFGRFLRKYSLDELPQLINVLKGDMS